MRLTPVIQKRSHCCFSNKSPTGINQPEQLAFSIAQNVKCLCGRLLSGENLMQNDMDIKHNSVVKQINEESSHYVKS